MRFRLRYSLRTFLICCVILGCGLGWFGAKLNAARKQAAAVERFRSLHLGWVFYDYQLEIIREHANSPASKSGSPPTMLPPEPEWLISLLGVDFFHRVEEFSFSPDVAMYDPSFKRPFAEKAKCLECLKAFPDLQTVMLYSCPDDYERVADLSFEHLTPLSHLQTLVVSKTRLTSEQFVHLQVHRLLKRLCIYDCELAPGAMESLGMLPAIEEFVLHQTKVLDATDLEKNVRWPSLRHVKLFIAPIDDRVLIAWSNSPQLETLRLGYQSDISPAGLEALQKLPRLRLLELGNHQLSDAELATIPKHFPALEHLKLKGSKAGSETVQTIRKNPRLKWIDLQGTPAAKNDALRHLQRDRPDLHIEGLKKRLTE